MARPEHEEAPQRQGIPPGDRDRDQPPGDPRQGVPGPGRAGKPDRPAAVWDKWIGKNAVDRSASFDSGKAKDILAAAGYKDTNSDGFVANKDGSPIELKIAVPERMVGLGGAAVITDSLKAAGINVTSESSSTRPDRGPRHGSSTCPRKRQAYGNTPWTYYEYIYQLPSDRKPRRPELRALHRPERLEPDQTARPDTGVEHRRDSVDHPAPDDVPGRARHPPLVQRAVVDVHHQDWTAWPSPLAPNTTPTSWRNYCQMRARHAHPLRASQRPTQ